MDRPAINSTSSDPSTAWQTKAGEWRFTLEDTSVDVEVSLNQGIDGTFSNSKTMKLFQQPVIAAVEPNAGPASGGTVVTITGSGFDAFSDDYEERESQMRCRFGDIVQPVPPSSHTATEVVCATTFGPEKAEVVTVALNGEAFAPSQQTFSFIGFHKPQVIDVYFHQSATKIMLIFDD